MSPSTKWFLGIGSAMLMYALSSLFVFDFSKPAISLRHQLFKLNFTDDGRIGPRPYEWASSPVISHMPYYEANDWPFVAYYPICYVYVLCSKTTQR